MANELFVTLTESDNTYLKYPCRGWLELFEIGTDGSIIIGVFRQLKEGEGVACNASCPVEVRNVKFTFNSADVHFRTHR